ncbi:MAG TPA: DUF302 domain-containing protein [Hyphomicrobiaceae bacterium]|jgi:uncharacterized protein (DUF302 family)|nr:DUF302 domain-containing protein [Hyphomicrobiaceae bacterium]
MVLRALKSGPAFVLAVALAAGPAASQEDFRTYTKRASYDDVKFELSNAITERGLAVDLNGQVGEMLDRTGADVGSTKKIYTHSEFFAFCSAKLSRAAMEADPSNIGLCPYVVFMYEAADKPGEVVVGYRHPTQRGSEASKKAIAEIDALLDGIAKDAVK